MTATFAATSPACPRCGRALPADAPAGLCPRCLLSDGFGDRSEADYTFRTDGRRFVPPTVEELAGEFPNLEFVRLLGSGGMGAVYLAKQVRLDRPIAVKVLPPDLADDPAFAERFLREARALARLSHPNIVSVFDFGQTPGGLYYFLMEYIDGPTLRQVVAGRSATPQQALEIVRQVCDALQYAHDKGIVHRDIKPENILLDAQGRPKIADFGLAKLLGLAEPHGSPAAGSLTHTQQAMGTPHYMAPEQIVGSRGVDHRADIYSLGVVFYELLTGELPLGRFAPPSKKVQVDVRLDEVVLRALEAEPAQRYQRASEVKTAVESITSHPEGGGLWFLPPAAPAPAVRFVKQATAGAARAAATVLQPGGPAEVSRTAVVAAVLAVALLPVVLLAFAAPPVALLAVMIAIGATVTGILGVQEVLRSGGRLSGLVPAFGAAVVVPLALIDLVILGVCAIPAEPFAERGIGTYDDSVVVLWATLFALPLWVFVDRRIVRALWRRMTAGLPPELVERELSVIPPVVRSVARAVAACCDRFWAGVRDLFGGVRREALISEGPAGGTASASADGGGLSAKAAGSAALVAAFVIGGVLFLMLENTHPSDPVIGVLRLLVGAFAFPAVVAPVGAPLLGWIAAREIRESGGRLTGLGLAVFAMLAFPLFALDVVLCLASAGVTALIWLLFGFLPHPAPIATAFGIATGIAVALVLCALVDAWVVRAVWRRFRPAAGAAGEVGAVGAGPGVEPRPRRDLRELWVGAAVLAVGLALFVIRVWREQSGGPAPPTPPAAPTLSARAVDPGMASGFGTAAAPEEDPNRRWRRGPNGPEVSRLWAQAVLGISPEAEAQINDVLRETAAAYERLLDSHTTVAFDGDMAKFTVRPFERETDRLANEFWSRVDPLLSRRQQEIMRYNFPLRNLPSGYGTRTGFGYEDLVMPLGGDGQVTQIEIGRSGQWYVWTATGYSGRMSSPELPGWLRPFQERYEVLASLRRQGAAIDPQRPPLVARKPAPAWAVGADSFAPGL